MKKVYCSFENEEYERLTEEAQKLGLSISKLVEYAAMLYVDMPRKDDISLADIQMKIESFLAEFTGESFICATPFGSEWAQMTTSAKRTAAAQMKKKEEAGEIKKIEPSTRHHTVSRYKKIDENKVDDRKRK